MNNQDLNSIIILQNVYKQFSRKKQCIWALKNISLEIKRGEIHVFLGVNGAGKTTLCSIIASILAPTRGDVYFNQKLISKNVVNYRYNIGFCPQKSDLDLSLNVEENLVFAGRYFSLSRVEAHDRALKIMKEFNLEKYSQYRIADLSGGFRQRLLIARSLMHKPQILILDEPTIALDPAIRIELWNIITQLKKQGITIIMTTHYLDEAESLADLVCILDSGNIIFNDSMERIKSEKNKCSFQDFFLDIVKRHKHEDL